MKWIKRGKIFDSSFNKDGWDWMQKYTAVPVVDHIEGDLYKVYYISRNADNRSQTGYFTFRITDPTNILEISKDPILTLGPLGGCRDSLIAACSLAKTPEGDRYLYTTGWASSGRTRYYPSIGLAISRDGGETYEQYSNAPVVDKSDDDPFGQATPTVMYDNGIWRMWYASYRKWELRDGEPWPTYELRYAESTDGVNWKKYGQRIIGSDGEEAVAKPDVIFEDGIYKMWYSYRVNYKEYKIGYAESPDAIRWERKDDIVGIDTSDEGWDSEMIEYPALFDHAGTRYMLYNGNTFGLTGIGLAELEK